MRVINIICDMQDSSLSGKALAKLKDKGYEIDLRQYGTSDIDANEMTFHEISELLPDCSLVIIRVHAGLTYFKKFDRLKERLIAENVSLIILSEMAEDVKENRSLFQGSESDYVTIRSYLELGGVENECNLYAWLLKEVDSIDIDVKEPVRGSMQGYYEPGEG